MKNFSEITFLVQNFDLAAGENVVGNLKAG